MFVVRTRWSIGSGASISILNEPWLPNGECIGSDITGAHFDESLRQKLERRGCSSSFQY